MYRSVRRILLGTLVAQSLQETFFSESKDLQAYYRTCI
jgi:hypothetical protein